MNTTNTKVAQSPPIVNQVALYARVSSQEQAREGVSLADQRRRLELLAQANGWMIAGVYSDEGYSGGTDDRPELQRLLHDARAGAFNLVVVTKLDRFFRNIRLTLNAIHELEINGITFIATDDNIDTRQPGMGKMLLNMLASMAEFERERIGERIRDFRAHLTAKGQWSAGRTPFGYRFNKTTKQLIIDPLEAEAVRFIFTTYTSKRIGILQTAELAIKEGIVTPRQGRRKHTLWTQSAIRYVLTHPAYIGGPNDQWPFNTPAIIKADLWEAAQRQLQGNKHFRATESHSPFAGLFRCGLCGHTLRIGFNHNTDRVWECPGRLKRLHLDNSPRCSLPRLKIDALEAEVIERVFQLFGTPGELERYIEATITNLDKEKRILERRLRPITGSLDRLKEIMEKADTMFQLGRLAPDDYKARIAGARASIREMERQQDSADPMLLRQLADTQKSIEYYRALDAFGEAMRARKERDSSKGLLERKEPILSPEMMSAMTKLQATGEITGHQPAFHLAPFSDTPFYLIPNEADYRVNPKAKSAELLRMMGLFVYFYAKNIEIKGAIRQTNISPGYRSAHYPRFQ